MTLYDDVTNGNIFRVTGPLCGEFTGDRWIPLTNASDAELWCLNLICALTYVWVNTRDAGDLRHYGAHYDVTVMTRMAGILGDFMALQLNWLFWFSAEKKTSLGKDWHPACLKCKKCSKTLNPGGHAEVKSMMDSWHANASTLPALCTGNPPKNSLLRNFALFFVVSSAVNCWTNSRDTG